MRARFVGLIIFANAFVIGLELSPRSQTTLLSMVEAELETINERISSVSL